MPTSSRTLRGSQGSRSVSADSTGDLQQCAEAGKLVALTGELLESECAFEGNDFRRIVDFKLLPKNYGVALNHISRNGAVFNPEYAPSEAEQVI
jgi:hypothetical protein